jgi:methylmalonyl-CoA/ethylmalonyl-CoA epimerase
MKVNKIDHICIAVKNLAEAQKVWESFLGKSGPDDVYVDDAEKIRVARYMVGEVGFELMESTTPDGEVAKFVQKRGEGIMLLSFNVDNTRAAVEELQDKGFSLIPDPRGEIARPFRNCEFAFVRPKNLNGVLSEIIDYKWDEMNSPK